jgi:hypothetical protein
MAYFFGCMGQDLTFLRDMVQLVWGIIHDKGKKRTERFNQAPPRPEGPASWIRN